MWFEQLTGFPENNPEQVRSNLILDGQRITSRVNGRTMTCGSLETPSLAELRERHRAISDSNESLSVRELVGDVGELHRSPASAGAFFQVASQFNLLEMISPAITPEDGVTIYENDLTQGPACAIAAGAGTIFRNYFANTGNTIGQTSATQIDCLGDIGHLLGNAGGELWQMQNGYCLPTNDGLQRVAGHLSAIAEQERDELRAALRIGLQSDTEVTFPGCAHLVTQAFCSALPVSYTALSPALWEPFARLVLEAAYEATLLAALENFKSSGNRLVFLTLLGDGAFGNKEDWILEAIQRALLKAVPFPLDVAIVSYRESRPAVKALCDANNKAAASCL